MLMRPILLLTSLTTGNLATPADFLQAISTPRRGDLQQAVSGLTGEDWNALFGLDGTQLKSAGVTPKQRRCAIFLFLLFSLVACSLKLTIALFLFQIRPLGPGEISAGP